MKRITRIFLAILVLITMCLCLCGCDELDTLRSEQAFWEQEGNYDTIIYKGVKYKRFELEDYYDTMYNSDEHKTIMVTDPDVPVLLSLSMGDAFTISDDGNFIHVDTFSYNYYNYYLEDEPSFSSNIILNYCKEDIYEQVIKEVENGINFTGYGTTLEKYNAYTGEFTYDYYYFTENETKAINNVLENVEPEYVDAMDSLWSLDKISDSKYFCEYWAYEIALINSQYYIVQYDVTSDLILSYKATDEVNEIFSSIYNYHTEDTYAF